jgi:hypothetical protein
VATPEDSPLTPTQAANFRLLRRVIFGTTVVCFAFLLWRSMSPGGQISNMLQQSGLARMGENGRAAALALSVLAGLVFAWFAATNIAKILARRIE